MTLLQKLKRSHFDDRPPGACVSLLGYVFFSFLSPGWAVAPEINSYQTCRRLYSYHHMPKMSQHQNGLVKQYIIITVNGGQLAIF